MQTGNMKPIRVYLESFGCSANMADGERMLGCLETAGFKTVSNPQEAEVLIYNTCAVKGPTEDRMISLLKAAPKGRKLIVAGCLPLINFERLRREVTFDGVVGPAPTSEIIEAVGKVIKGERPVVLKVKPKPEPDAPVKALSPVRRIIVAAYGCLGACSFCCVKFARGSLRSYRPEEVLGQVERAVRAGAKEIWLTSQDLSCYGLDIGSNLAELLERVMEVEGNFKVRVGMMNPNHLLPILGRLVKAFTHPKIFKFLHVPVQSGSNRILRLMNRPYTSRDFEAIIAAFRSRIPDVTLATDVICGFPGETEEDFQQTLNLIEESRPDIVNLSKFYPRPRTPASRMEKLPTQIVKERSRVLTELAGSIALERNREWIGWEGEILIDEEGWKGNLIGRNYAYKPVAVSRGKIGETVKVKIVEAARYYLKGETQPH